MDHKFIGVQLPPKKIEFSEYFSKQKIEKIQRVLSFNPEYVYNKIGDKLDPFKRHQGITMEKLFPKLDGVCSCGCDAEPKMSKPGVEPKWQQKWASDICSGFASDVLSIINNYFQKPAFYINIYSGNKCADCDAEYNLQLDHIIGVKQGGGACWLSNYRWLCHDCHVAKTNADFGRKSKVSSKKGQFKIEI